MSIQTTLGERIQAAWHRLAEFWRDRTDIQIWRSHERNGETHWHVFDPQTDHTDNFASEAEMRIWIDERHD